MTINLDEALEHLVTSTEEKTPTELTYLLMAMIDTDDYEAVLFKALPQYVRYWISQRRVWREEPALLPLEEEQFAPDDLLTPEGQDIQRKIISSKRTSRTGGIAERVSAEWQRHFRDRIWNGSQYILFGEATAVDLKGAAVSLRSQAISLHTKADYYDQVASHLGDTKRVADLTTDPTRS